MYRSLERVITDGTVRTVSGRGARVRTILLGGSHNAATKEKCGNKLARLINIINKYAA